MSANSVLYSSLIDFIFSLPLCNLVTVCPMYTRLLSLLPFYWFVVLILVHICCSCTNKMVHCYSCRSAGITPVMESHTKIQPLCMLSKHYISSESYTDVRCHKTRIFLLMWRSLIWKLFPWLWLPRWNYLKMHGKRRRHTNFKNFKRGGNAEVYCIWWLISNLRSTVCCTLPIIWKEGSFKELSKFQYEKGWKLLK